MLNENQINLLPERIYERLNAVNSEYLVNVGRIIQKTGELRPTDIHELNRMYNYGDDMDKVIRKLSEVSEKNIAEIYDIFDIVAKENYNYSKPFYKAKEIPFIPYEENKKLQSYVRAMAENTVNEYVNLTQHTAFAVFEKDGKSIAPLFANNKNKVATTLSDTYTKLADYAVTQVQMGMTSYNKVMKDVIKAFAQSGIKTVDYATGYSRRLDTAVRQNILWGIKECNQKTADYIGEEFGADGYEISYHSNPRESHADMAGKQFALGEGKTVNGKYYPPFSSVAHLLEEYNCLHFKFSIILGVSEPAYSDEQLEEFKENDKRIFEFEGKEYSMYEGTQLQRRIESSIRNQRDILSLAKATGDTELEREAKEKISLLTGKYNQLSKTSGLPTKMERTKLAVKVDKFDGSGIINEQSNKGVTKITDTAINSVSKLQINGLTEEQNLYVQQQHKELLKYSRGNNNKEVAFVFRKGFTERIEVVGSDDEIEFGTVLFGKGNGLFIMHNHPRNSSFSIKDITFVLSNQNVKTLSIVKNNGKVETLTKLSSYDMLSIKNDLSRIVKTTVYQGTKKEYDKVVKQLLSKHSKEGGMFEWIIE